MTYPSGSSQMLFERTEERIRSLGDAMLRVVGEFEGGNIPLATSKNNVELAQYLALKWWGMQNPQPWIICAIAGIPYPVPVYPFRHLAVKPVPHFRAREA